MQKARTGDEWQRQVLWTHAAGCGPRAEVAEYVSVRAVMNEIHRRRRVGIHTHSRHIDVLFVPKSQKLAAELIIAQARDVSHASALSSRRDRRIHRVTAEALPIQVRLAAHFAELIERLAKRDDIGAIAA